MLFISLYSFGAKSKLLGCFYNTVCICSLLVRTGNFTYFADTYFISILSSDGCKACSSAVGYIMLFYTVIFHLSNLFPVFNRNAGINIPKTILFTNGSKTGCSTFSDVVLFYAIVFRVFTLFQQTKSSHKYLISSTYADGKYTL